MAAHCVRKNFLLCSCTLSFFKMSQNARHAVTLFQDISGLTGQHGLLFGVYL
ncbi:hypothetical protein ACSTB0_13490, partial [Faecalibacterium wellingii]|uniref:hypothetical protein n=1 Tax=Faecalibacterium wellingii TaxID=2929491 RepID=UPI003ED9C3D4